MKGLLLGLFTLLKKLKNLCNIKVQNLVIWLVFLFFKFKIY